eukprot:SAG31_NODE_1225_length_9271_cov_10.376472_8_plen_284_part_00
MGEISNNLTDGNGRSARERREGDMQMPENLADLPSLGSCSGTVSDIDLSTLTRGANQQIKFELDTVRPASFAESTVAADNQETAPTGMPDADVLKRRLDQLQKRRTSGPRTALSDAAPHKGPSGPVPVVQRRRRANGRGQAGGPLADVLTRSSKSGSGAADPGSKGMDKVAAKADGGGTKAPPLPWSKEEIRKLKALVAAEGVGAWQQKAAQLGTGRTAKAVHTRWLRDTGRIIDLPRGQKNMLNVHMTSEDVNQQAAILDQSAYLLPMVSGSLGLAFAAATE